MSSLWSPGLPWADSRALCEWANSKLWKWSSASWALFEARHGILLSSFVVHGPPLMSTCEVGWHQQADINEPLHSPVTIHEKKPALRDPLLAAESTHHCLVFGLFVLTYLISPVIWFCIVDTFGPNSLPWPNTWVVSVSISTQKVSLYFYLKILDFRFGKLYYFALYISSHDMSCNGIPVELRLVFADTAQ